MIPITRFKELLETLQEDVNIKLEDSGFSIDHVLIAVSEDRMTKKISDTKGVVLAAKMPSAVADVQTTDEYSENNQCLFFILEKQEPSRMTNENELAHFSKMQSIMKKVKEHILNHGLNNNQETDPETLSKPFRTEWEYQLYGNFNGLSISFDLKDFEL